jgi:hypothetical protein
MTELSEVFWRRLIQSFVDDEASFVVSMLGDGKPMQVVT